MNFLFVFGDSLLHLLAHTAEDVFYLIPYFFLTYLLLEYLEHKTQSKLQKIIQKTNRFSPFWGALAGITGGCGLAAAAANFYVTHVISLGTLIAIYLATSDEMLPLMISHGISGLLIVKILSFKIVFAILIGLMINFYQHPEYTPHFKEICHQAHCQCQHNPILKSALIHTLQLTVFVFFICFALNIFLYFVPLSHISAVFSNHKTGSVFLSALIGLIPNCGISIALTQFYIEGIISVNALIAGLLSNSGVGLIVLYKLKPNFKELLKISILLLIAGVIGGHMAGFLF